MRKVLLDELPKRNRKINWKKSIGCKIKFIYNDIEGEIKIVNYEVKEQKLYIKYLDTPIFEISTNGFQRCAFGDLLGIITNKFKIEIGQIFKDNKRDLIIIDRKYIKSPYKKNTFLKYYKYKCNKCGFECGGHYRNGENHEEHWIEESNLLQGKGCAVCCSPPQIVVQGINDIATTNPKLGNLLWDKNDKYKYTKNSNQKVNWKCPDCDEIIKNKKISNINKEGLSCPKCGDKLPYPEKFVFNFLQQLNIDFTYQYNPEWIKPKRYDFYFELNRQRYIVETDGDWHNKDNNISGQTKEDSKYIDDMKNKLAREHNIEVIRIDCKKSELEWIKEYILHSKLNNLFDLSKIDWLQCHKFACNNLVKKVCNLWNNEVYSTKKISEIMKLNRTTIIKYLKQGSKIWDWCDYDPKEESFKASRKSGKMNGKLVEIYKDGISLGKFESCAELERQSEELFGFKLLQSKISNVCNSKRKTHKGFTFKYI